MIQECSYSNGGNVKSFSKVITKSVYEPKFVYLHILLQINEDFEYDLLQDTIELIDYEVYDDLRFDA
jgi:hypothetical protein